MMPLMTNRVSRSMHSTSKEIGAQHDTAFRHAMRETLGKVARPRQALTFVFKDVLDHHFVTFHELRRLNLGDFGDEATWLVADKHAFEKHDELKGVGDLATDGDQGHVDAAHQVHRLNALD